MQTRGSWSGIRIGDSGAASDVVEEGNPIAAASDQELAEDLIAIVTSFTASYHGRRAAENKKTTPSNQKQHHNPRRRFLLRGRNRR